MINNKKPYSNQSFKNRFCLLPATGLNTIYGTPSPLIPILFEAFSLSFWMLSLWTQDIHYFISLYRGPMYSSSNKLFSILTYIERRALVEVESPLSFFFPLLFWQGRYFLLQILPFSLCMSLNGMMVSLSISAHLNKCLDNAFRKMVWFWVIPSNSGYSRILWNWWCFQFNS